MDKSWMTLSRVSPDYLEGVDRFLDYAFSNTVNSRIPCPCIKCLNCFYQIRDVVRTHLIVKGIILNYVQWIYHGEEYIPRYQVNQPEVIIVDLSEVREKALAIEGRCQEQIGQQVEEAVQQGLQNSVSGLPNPPPPSPPLDDSSQG